MLSDPGVEWGRDADGEAHGLGGDSVAAGQGRGVIWYEGCDGCKGCEGVRRYRLNMACTVRQWMYHQRWRHGGHAGQG